MIQNSDPVLFAVNLAFNLLLFGCLIAAGVAVAFRLIKNANPRLRYLIAVAAFLFAAILPLAFTLIGSVNWDKFIETKNIGDGKSFDGIFSERTFAIAAEIASLPPKPEPEKTLSDYLNNFTAALADSFAGKILFGLWVPGAIGFAFRDVFALWQLRKMGQFWREATVSERKELAVPDDISLRFGEESPATVGLFYPVIVLPKSFPDDLSLLQKRFIVRHELSHARWRDPLVNFILRLMRAAFWLSPALWMLEWIVAGERETAADRAAVGNRSPNESESENARLNYATTLISVAKHFNSDARRGSLLGANTVGLYNGSILENRVRRLLARSSKTTNFRILLAAAILAGGFAGLFFMPVAFRVEAIKRDAQAAAVIENQETDESLQSENANGSQSHNVQNEPPRLIGFKNKEMKTETDISNQNGNKPQQFSRSGTENYQIPRVIMVKRKSPGTWNDDAVDSSEDLMRKLGEEDARRSGLRQKLDELSGKVQGLDEARKNLGSSIPQVRQKAASQIDSLMRQAQTVNDSGRKSN
ncbi:MAG TPA: M56 family metallopeptidase [Pyrinomonadaceae bacterium]|jgi:beta-lactamase regulating signal transducer with metallopeptidase domain